MKTLNRLLFFLLFLFSMMQAVNVYGQDHAENSPGKSAQRSFGSFNCDSFCVVSIVFDTISGDSLYVTIANNDTNFISYPVVQLIDSAGDTVANAAAYFYYFGQLAHSQQTYQIYTTLTSFPANWHGQVRLSEGGTQNACIIKYPCSQTVTDVAAAENNPGFDIYPNPVGGGECTISSLNFITAEIWLSDMMGRLVLKIKPKTGADKILLSVSSLPAGIYFIELTGAEKKRVRKLVVGN